MVCSAIYYFYMFYAEEMSEEYEEIKTLLELISKAINDNKKDGNVMTVLTTCWITLFVLIVLQKTYKYIVRPIMRRRELEQQQQQQAINNNRVVSECELI